MVLNKNEETLFWKKFFHVKNWTFWFLDEYGVTKWFQGVIKKVYKKEMKIWKMFKMFDWSFFSFTQCLNDHEYTKYSAHNGCCD